MRQILRLVPAFRVYLRIAGRADAKILAFPNGADQIRRVGKIVFRRLLRPHPLLQIAPQRHHATNARVLQFGKVRHAVPAG